MSFSAEAGKLHTQLKELGIELGNDHHYMDEDGDYDECTLPHFLECAMNKIKEQNKKIELLEKPKKKKLKKITQ